MVHFINLFGTENDKNEQSCNPSQVIETSRVCDEALGHEEEGKGSQINSFFNFSPSGISSHKEGL